MPHKLTPSSWVRCRPFGTYARETDMTQQNYVDYFKCVNAKGEDFAPCHQFKKAYRSLCPNEWVSRAIADHIA